MGHLRVVLFNKELDQDTKPLDRIEGGEKKPLMLHRTPERLNHRVGRANIDLRENSVQASSEQSGIHRGLDVLDARIDVDDRLASANNVLAGGKEKLARATCFIHSSPGST